MMESKFESVKHEDIQGRDDNLNVIFPNEILPPGKKIENDVTCSNCPKCPFVHQSICPSIHVSNCQSCSVNAVKIKKEVKIECPTCGKVLFSKKAFNDHKLTHVTKKCDKCEKYISMSSSREREKHRNICTYKNEYRLNQCTVCNYKSFIKYDLQRHYKYRHSVSTNRKTYQCQFCDFFTQDTKKQFKIHLRSHTPNLKCENCWRIFHSEKKLTAHIKRAHDSNIFTCKKCSKSFNNKEESKHKNHSVKLEVEVELLKCDKCNFTTTKRFNLKRHIWRRHGRPKDIPKDSGPEIVSFV